MSDKLLPELFSKISEFITAPTRLIVHSDLTQSMGTDPNTILWRTEPINTLTKELLSEFAIAAYKRKCTFYKVDEDKLLYHEFCIALICASQYGLNHNTMRNIPSRSFLSAWRTITVISQNNPELKNWLNKYIGGRDNKGYSNNLGVKLNNMAAPTTALRYSTPSPTLVSHEIILAMACGSRKVVSIGPGAEFDMDIPIAKCTSMNEGQLMNVVMVHDILVTKY